jgi:hypothetical protein
VTQDTPIVTGVTTVVAPIEATRSGLTSNQPLWIPPRVQTITTEPLFDASATLRLMPLRLLAAGGSDGQKDSTLRRAAKASFTGRYGPTFGAIVAGALRENGVAHVVVREDAIRGISTGAMRVYAADESWAVSLRFLSRLRQSLIDGWLGFGCRLDPSPYLVANQSVRLDLTISLRDARSLADTTTITDAVQAALRRYFDERLDWWVWRTSAIQGVVSHADRRILACSAATVREVSGVPLDEPGATPIGDIVHFALADNPTNILYLPPT